LRELLHRGAVAVALDVRPATGRWSRVIGPRASEVIFSPTPLIDRDGIRALIETHGISHIIHLAAWLTPDCQRDPFRGCEANVLGSTAVFDAARLAGTVRAMALASSYAVYGADGHPESAPPMFYGAFKQAVDAIAGQYWQHFGLRTLAIRPHVVYGPERESGLTAGPSLACRAAVRGERYEIGYTGIAGYDYVEDVARAFVRGVEECPPGATVADLPSEPASTHEIVERIERCCPEAAGRIRVSGPPLPSNHPTAPRDIRQVLPGWEPTPLASGIARTIEYHRRREGSA
jgi:nucleoside-diphosphate-sugar epimerase